MNILIRADASVAIGTGHVMRTLTLAELLRDARCDVRFAMKEEEGHLCSYVESRGFSVFRIASARTQEDDAQATIQAIDAWGEWIDWCIVDHYGLDARWEQQIRRYVQNVMVIDDLANRPHVCDVLLDQNYYLNSYARYERLVPTNCTLLLGPKYVLLRKEFTEAREMVRMRTGEVNRLLVFFGGSDPTNETEKALRALRSLRPMHVDVVVGATNPRRHVIERMCSEMGARYHCQIDYIAELMAKADLAVGAGGATMWERCFLGLPSLVTVVADNQKVATEAVAAYGAIQYVGWHEHVTTERYVEVMKRALETPKELVRMSERSLKLMGTKRERMHPVVRRILEG
ncbi:UDP-2,4-diacetamido-2,4,6-trideoxy-beta-L-altropyranose hydrolase [Anoxybacillus sp. TBDG-1]